MCFVCVKAHTKGSVQISIGGQFERRPDFNVIYESVCANKTANKRLCFYVNVDSQKSEGICSKFSVFVHFHDDETISSNCFTRRLLQWAEHTYTQRRDFPVKSRAYT